MIYELILINTKFNQITYDAIILCNDRYFYSIFLYLNIDNVNNI